jgi:glycosyltransferase involved in cell wall biosynthesis
MSFRKMLFIAFACEPGRGSEMGVGWAAVRGAATHRPVHVICHEESRPGFEKYLANPSERHHPITATFVSIPSLSWMWKCALTVNVYYYLWQLKVARIAKQIIQSDPTIEAIQHSSFVRYWMPSAGGLAAHDTRLPFIWGPVGGGDAIPWGFKRDVGWKGMTEDAYRWLIRAVMERDPLVTRTARAASILIASTEETYHRMQRLFDRQIELMEAVAQPIDRWADYPTPPRSADEPFRFVSVGRMERWRGLHYGINAFARANLPNAVYDLIGDGHAKRDLVKLVRSLGIADRVRFLGEMPYAECVEAVASSDVLVHPALRDSIGCVAEALALRKPVICAKTTTPAMFVNEHCGFCIPTKTPAQLTADTAEAMTRLYSDPDLYKRLGAGGAVRARQMSREHRTACFERLYERVNASIHPNDTHVRPHTHAA